MLRGTFDETALARLFLAGVATVGLATSLLGWSPEEIRLVPCPFHAITGVDCPGCGMTRACAAMGQGQLGKAWDFHPLVFGLAGLAIGFAFFPNCMRTGWSRLPRVARHSLLAVALSLVLAIWLCRLDGF